MTEQILFRTEHVRSDSDRIDAVSAERPTTSDEIRETFLRFFEAHGHRRLASASLVPAANDPSALFTVAGNAVHQGLAAAGESPWV